MSQGEAIKSGDRVFVVSKKSGEVVEGRSVIYVGEVGEWYLVKVPVVLRQGLEWVVCSFSKEEWGLVREE